MKLKTRLKNKILHLFASFSMLFGTVSFVVTQQHTQSVTKQNDVNSSSVNQEFNSIAKSSVLNFTNSIKTKINELDKTNPKNEIGDNHSVQLHRVFERENFEANENQRLIVRTKGLKSYNNYEDTNLFLVSWDHFRLEYTEKEASQATEYDYYPLDLHPYISYSFSNIAQLIYIYIKEGNETKIIPKKKYNIRVVYYHKIGHKEERERIVSNLIRIGFNRGYIAKRYDEALLIHREEDWINPYYPHIYDHKWYSFWIVYIKCSFEPENLEKTLRNLEDTFIEEPVHSVSLKIAKNQPDGSIKFEEISQSEWTNYGFGMRRNLENNLYNEVMFSRIDEFYNWYFLNMRIVVNGYELTIHQNDWPSTDVPWDGLKTINDSLDQYFIRPNEDSIIYRINEEEEYRLETCVAKIGPYRNLKYVSATQVSKNAWKISFDRGELNALGYLMLDFEVSRNAKPEEHNVIDGRKFIHSLNSYKVSILKEQKVFRAQLLDPSKTFFNQGDRFKIKLVGDYTNAAEFGYFQLDTNAQGPSIANAFEVNTTDDASILEVEVKEHKYFGVYKYKMLLYGYKEKDNFQPHEVLFSAENEAMEITISGDSCTNKIHYDVQPTDVNRIFRKGDSLILNAYARDRFNEKVAIDWDRIDWVVNSKLYNNSNNPWFKVYYRDEGKISDNAIILKFHFDEKLNEIPELNIVMNYSGFVSSKILKVRLALNTNNKYIRWTYQDTKDQQRTFKPNQVLEINFRCFDGANNPEDYDWEKMLWYVNNKMVDPKNNEWFSVEWATTNWTNFNRVKIKFHYDLEKNKKISNLNFLFAAAFVKNINPMGVKIAQNEATNHIEATTNIPQEELNRKRFSINQTIEIQFVRTNGMNLPIHLTDEIVRKIKIKVNGNERPWNNEDFEFSYYNLSANKVTGVIRFKKTIYDVDQFKFEFIWPNEIDDITKVDVNLAVNESRKFIYFNAEHSDINSNFYFERDEFIDMHFFTQNGRGENIGHLQYWEELEWYLNDELIDPMNNPYFDLVWESADSIDIKGNSARLKFKPNVPDELLECVLVFKTKHSDISINQTYTFYHLTHPVEEEEDNGFMNKLPKILGITLGSATGLIALAGAGTLTYRKLKRDE